MNGKDAIISPCGLYRYRLDRYVQPEGPVIAYIGVNPSTADATVDDHTVRKWIGFTKKMGGSRFVVANLFGYRATDVEDLKRVDDPQGDANLLYLKQIVLEADIIVPCWGNRGKLPKGLRSHPGLILSWIRSLVHDQGKQILTFGLTKGGDPKHPLTLGYETEMIPL